MGQEVAVEVMALSSKDTFREIGGRPSGLKLMNEDLEVAMGTRAVAVGMSARATFGQGATPGLLCRM